ncbi:unnamed protein product, partial [Mesorhabditis belari]|uniref:Uncharacterized protein n=1 Tax=Mesorhabditis belari TaxID=2138241 RepID=A0AAF3EQZ3_9BILA
MLLRIAAICLLTSTISVVCRHFHKHHHQKHSKRHVTFDEPSEETLERIEKTLPTQIECWKSEPSEEAEGNLCVLTDDQNSDEFFAACMSIVNVTSGCWIHQSISLQNCKPDCVVRKGFPAPFCCCTTDNCNHPSRIVYED